ncbi:alpha/beta hydrolase [Peredibacter starrii]|uniref:Alpha/beta fold hydrolase n=1 Tax=Peredibacter starrii TaxID=28202 RepID=A0AAX4HIV5_9BACT|nr:alpha/beta fold hydrolase [Peredibacter starrii]WPU63164.1 alpha/beta fold hydrolase [Peredibacter starrii]
MTNSYSLSQSRPRILFIHGLNNNSDSFKPIMQHFESRGFETEFLILPGHDDNRKEARDFESSLALFDQKMKALGDRPYYVIAFSHGALYLQLWMEKNPTNKPLKQALLAPALYTHRQGTVRSLLAFLPAFLWVKSLSPKEFRRYEFLTVAEYRMLLKGMVTLHKLERSFQIPTMVMIDPKDELVDAETLKEEVEKKNETKVIFYERGYLNKGLGSHHILFHPDYFLPNDWTLFMSSIEDFFLHSDLRNHS